MPTPPIIFSNGVASFELNLQVIQRIGWDPTWRELDLVLGIAEDNSGNQTTLKSPYYVSNPRDGVELADIILVGSERSNRIFLGVGSYVDAASGSDELFNTESQGGNLLIGGLGSDEFFLNRAADFVIGGRLISQASAPRSSNLYPTAAVTDQSTDSFFVLSDTAAGNTNQLSIVDYELDIDQVLIDGEPVSKIWQQAKIELLNAGVAINAAPILTASATPASLILIPGVKTLISPAAFGEDPDGDRLNLVVLNGPAWIVNDGTSISVNTPATLRAGDLGSINLELGLYDGKAIKPFAPKLIFQAPSVSNGSASFLISGASIPGSPAVGQTLTANNTTADPDGNGTFTYQWQSSLNGDTWSTLGSNSQSYTVAATDEGKQLRLVVSYNDAYNFSETVATLAGTVPDLRHTRRRENTHRN